MIKPRALLLLSLVLGVAACAPPYPGDEAAGKAADAQAEPAPVVAVSDGDLAAVRANIKKALPELAIEDLRATPLPGIYEIKVGLNFGYVSGDGAFLIAGDMTDLKTRREITEERRREARLALVNNLGRNVIEFAPQNQPAKYTVTVFTDIDCGYCRMLHKQIKAYNDEGIAVRYAFFPRSGPNTASFYKAEEVWCSADRKDALTKAKAGEPIGSDKSCDNPVMRHLQMAAALGLSGTPSIVLPDGELLPGYRPPAELLQVLDHAPAG